jgi:ribosomal protein S10
MEIKTNAKIRVRLESFNHELLNSSCKKIVEILQNTPLDSIGVVLYRQNDAFIVFYDHHM